MKYDSDLIDTIYFIKQQDPALAERMWDRLTAKVEPQVDFTKSFKKSLNVGFGLDISEEVFNYMKRNHSDSHATSFNKVAAIKALREKTGWGLKDAKDAVDYMLSQNMLSPHYQNMESSY